MDGAAHIEDKLMEEWRESGNIDLGSMLLAIESGSDEFTEEYSDKLNWLRDDFADKRGGLEGSPLHVGRDIFNYLLGAERWFQYAAVGFVAGTMFGLIPPLIGKIGAVTSLIPHRYSLNGKLSKAIDNQIRRIKTKNPFKRIGHCKSLSYLYNSFVGRCGVEADFKLVPFHIYSCLHTTRTKRKIVENTVSFGFGPIHYFLNGGVLIDLIAKKAQKESIIAMELIMRAQIRENRSEKIADYEKALELIENVEFPERGRRVAQHNLSLEYNFQGHNSNSDDAMRYYLKSMSTKPMPNTLANLIIGYVKKASDHVLRGEINTANEFFTKSLEANPSSDLFTGGAFKPTKRFQELLRYTYSNIGSMYFGLSDWDNAIKYYELAVETDKGEAGKKNLCSSLINRSQKRMKDEDWEGGFEDLKRAEKIDTNTRGRLASAYNNFGIHLLNTGDNDGAIKQFKIALRYEKNDKYRKNLKIARGQIKN